MKWEGVLYPVTDTTPSGAAIPQPPPQPGRVDVADYVLADIQERVAMGQRKYGTKLQTFNGRDALWDAYQEVLDLVMYLRQAILEREANEQQTPTSPASL